MAEQSIDLSNNQAMLRGLVRALNNGASGLPALPPEIIQRIFILARFIVSAPHLDFQTNAHFFVTTMGPLTRSSWMVTDPFDDPMLARIATVRVTTISRHQGWVYPYPEEGSFSWFELAIIPPASEEGQGNNVEFEHVKCRQDGTPLSWICHHHPVEQRERAHYKDVREFNGIVFDAEHELWNHLGPGDRLAVFGCVERRFWECAGHHAILQFEEFFNVFS